VSGAVKPTPSPRVTRWAVAGLATLGMVLAVSGIHTLTAQQGETAADPAARMAALEKRVQEQPSPAAWFELGDLRFRAGRDHAGFLALANAVRLAPAGHHSQSYLLHQLDKSAYKFDLSLHEDLEKILPDYPPLLERLGRLYQGKSGQDAAAEARFAKWVKLRPDSPAAHARLAEFYRAGGKAAEAVTHLKHVRELSGDSAYAQRRLGTLYRDLGDLEASATALEGAIDLLEAKDDRVAQLELGHTRMAQKRYKDAAAAFAVAVKLDDGAAVSHLYHGQALAAAGDTKAARAALEAAVRIEKKMQEAQLALGHLLLSQGDAAGALPHFREASAANDRDPEMHFLVGETALKAGNLQVAQFEHEKLKTIRATTLAKKLGDLIAAHTGGN